MEQEKVQNQILRFASDLTRHSLSPIEAKWITDLSCMIFDLSRMVYEPDVADLLAMEAVKVALKRLERRGRFPTSFGVLTCDMASSSNCAMKGDFARPWEVAEGSTGVKDGFIFKPYILIGWMVGYEGLGDLNGVEGRYGRIILMKDSLNKTLPLAPSPSLLPSVNHLFLATDWTYCPFTHTMADENAEMDPWSGYFEIGPNSAQLAGNDPSSNDTHANGHTMDIHSDLENSEASIIPIPESHSNFLHSMILPLVKPLSHYFGRKRFKKRGMILDEGEPLMDHVLGRLTKVSLPLPLKSHPPPYNEGEGGHGHDHIANGGKENQITHATFVQIESIEEENASEMGFTKNPSPSEHYSSEDPSSATRHRKTSVTLILVDSIENRRTLTEIQLIPLGTPCLFSHLSRASSRPMNHLPIYHYASTTQSSVIPLHPQRVKGDIDLQRKEFIPPPTKRRFVPSGGNTSHANHSDHTLASSSIGPTDAPHVPLEENHSDQSLHSYHGVVTRLLNNNCIELDGRYLILAHRVGGVGIGVRKGASISVKFAHLLFSQHSFIGFSLCAQSKIEILYFSPTWDSTPYWWVEERNERGEFPTAQTAFYLERFKSLYANHIPDIHRYTCAQLSRWLLMNEKKETGITLENLFFSPVIPMQSWFAHDHGIPDSEMGCRCMGIDINEYPSVMSLEVLRRKGPLLERQGKISYDHDDEPTTNSINLHGKPLLSADGSLGGLSRMPTALWHSELSYPLPFLNKDGSHHLFIGKLTCASDAPIAWQSNFLWLENFNRSCRVPIVLLGARICHLQVPLSLKHFTICKESTQMPRKAAGEMRSDLFQIFDFYLMSSIDHVSFLNDPHPLGQASTSVDLTDAAKKEAQEMCEEGNRGNYLEFDVLQSSLPQYKEDNEILPHRVTFTISAKRLGDRPFPESGSDTKLILSNLSLQLSPLIYEGASYRIGPVEKTSSGNSGKARSNNSNNHGQAVIFETMTSSPILTELRAPPLPTTKPTRQRHDFKSLLHGNANTSDGSYLAVIVARKHDLSWVHDDSPSPISRFMIPTSKHPSSDAPSPDTTQSTPIEELSIHERMKRQHRANFGEIILLLRALDSPDTITLYLKTTTTVLPLGLIPGMVVEVKGASAEHKKSARSSFLVIGRTRGHRSNANLAQISLLGLYPSVTKMLDCDPIGHLWHSISSLLHHPPIPNGSDPNAKDQGESERTLRIITSLELEAQLRSFLIPMKNDFSSPLTPNRHGIRSICGGSLYHTLISNIDWLHPSTDPQSHPQSSSAAIPFNPFLPPPYRHLGDLPQTTVMDRRLFHTTVSIDRIFHFYINSYCAGCLAPAYRSHCSQSCGFKQIVLNMKFKAQVGDGTGVAYMEFMERSLPFSPPSLSDLQEMKASQRQRDGSDKALPLWRCSGHDSLLKFESGIFALLPLSPLARDTILQVALRACSLSYEKGHVKLQEGAVPIPWDLGVHRKPLFQRTQPDIDEHESDLAYMFESDDDSDQELNYNGDGFSSDSEEDFLPDNEGKETSIPHLDRQENAQGEQEDGDKQMKAANAKSNLFKQIAKSAAPAFTSADVRCLSDLQTVLRDSSGIRAEILGHYYGGKRKEEDRPFSDLPYRITRKQKTLVEDVDDENMEHLPKSEQSAKLRRYERNIDVIWARPLSSSPLLILERAEKLLAFLKLNPN